MNDLIDFYRYYRQESCIIESDTYDLPPDCSKDSGDDQPVRGVSIVRDGQVGVRPENHQ